MTGTISPQPLRPMQPLRPRKRAHPITISAVLAHLGTLAAPFIPFVSAGGAVFLTGLGAISLVWAFVALGGGLGDD